MKEGKSKIQDKEDDENSETDVNNNSLDELNENVSNLTTADKKLNKVQQAVLKVLDKTYIHISKDTCMCVFILCLCV